MNDVFSLCRAGYLSVTKPFELIKYFQNEYSYIVWNIIIDNFRYILNILHSTDIFESFQHYMLEIIKPMIDIIIYNHSNNEVNRHKVEA